MNGYCHKSQSLPLKSFFCTPDNLLWRHSVGDLEGVLSIGDNHMYVIEQSSMLTIFNQTFFAVFCHLHDEVGFIFLRVHAAY